MPAVAELIEQVYDYVTNGRRAASVNTTATGIAYPSSATDITFNNATDGFIAASDIIEVGDEQMLVISMNHLSRTATVMRGYSGTSAIDISPNYIAYVQPAMFQRSVRQALVGEIKALSPRLTALSYYDVGPTINGQLFYEAAEFDDDNTVVGTLGISLGPFAGDTRLGWSHPRHQFIRNLPTDGTGKAGVLLADNPGEGRELRLAVARRFQTDVFNDTTDIVDEVGLDPSWVDIVVYGAAGRMLGRMEALRSMSDRLSGGDTTKVAPGSRAAGASWFFKRRDELIYQASLEYRGQFPFVEQW